MKVFYVIAFDIIKIQISWASQNDHEILSFVKAINLAKVIIEKSRGEVSLMGQDTIENVS